MPRQLEQTPRCCCDSAFGGFPRASGSDSSCLRRLILPACRPLARTVLHSCIKGFLQAKKLWVNPPKAERAKPSLSSDYNLLFKNKIGESSLDIHRLSCWSRDVRLATVSLITKSARRAMDWIPVEAMTSRPDSRFTPRLRRPSTPWSSGYYIRRLTASVICAFGKPESFSISNQP